MSEIFDGGPAFPRPTTDVHGEIAWGEIGMSKRELFAAILMHAEMMTGGPSSENAARAAEGADELLRALGAPQSQPTQTRELSYYEQEQLKAADRLAAAVSDIQKVSAYLAIPADLREPLERAMEDVTEPAIPF